MFFVEKAKKRGLLFPAKRGILYQTPDIKCELIERHGDRKQEECCARWRGVFYLSACARQSFEC